MNDALAPATVAGGELAPRVVLNPSTGPLPATLQADAIEPGPVVLLLNAHPDPGWAADAAIALAGSWAAAGRRIVLADLHLEEPVLHERLGEPNRDGVVDLFLYGASLSRSARPVSGHRFYLIPAGTYTADGGAVFRHPRWPKLLTGFRDVHASLLLFVPVDAAELPALAQWSEQVIVLGDGEGALARAEALLPAGLSLLALLAPPGEEVGSDLPAALADAPAAPDPVPPADLPPEAPAPAAEVSVPEIEPPAPERPGTEPPIPQKARAEAPRPVPPAAESREAPGGRRRVWSWLVLALLLLASGGAALLLLRPDLVANLDLRTRAPQAAPDSPLQRSVPTTSGVPAGVRLPFSVQLRAFRSPNPAREHIAEVQRQLGGQPAYISPELIQGILYYRVFAGFPADSAAAFRLRERLLAAGVIDPEDATDALDLIHYTPLAYQLGEYPSREAALARADSLAQVGIPAYPATMPYSNGSERWRVYGGAFGDSIRADGMRQLLAQAGLQVPLVERRGRPSESTP